MSLLSMAGKYLVSHVATTENIQKVKGSLDNEGKNINDIFKRIVNYPIKIIASFIFAPFLMVKVILTVKNPLRRIIALIGLILAIGMTYFLSSWLGRAAGFWLVYHTVGFWTGLGFLFGSFFSMVMTVLICTLIFNTICFIFLKMNTEDVIEHLKEIS